jgi:uncharacterized protein (TIGR02001 family)
MVPRARRPPKASAPRRAILGEAFANNGLARETRWHACCYLPAERHPPTPKDSNMRKAPQAFLLAAAGGFALAGLAARAEDPPAPDYTLTPKLALYSEYEYRGIGQSAEDPALQFNLDFAHKSGFYVGTFLSSIKWLKDTADANGFSTNANVEWDLYGGYRWEFVKDWTLDVGYLRYEYPGSGAFDPKPNTDEVYAGISYGIASLKYSYSFHDTFGVPASKGSDYIELGLNYALPVLPALTLNGIVGHQRYKGTQASGFANGDLSYTVWKAGATYDFGNGLNAGAYYKSTDADAGLYTVKGRDWSRDRVVGFVSYARTF